MEEQHLKELKKNNLLVTKDLDYKKNEATSFLRKSFIPHQSATFDIIISTYK